MNQKVFIELRDSEEESDSDSEVRKEKYEAARKTAVMGRCQLCGKFIEEEQAKEHLQQCLATNCPPDPVTASLLFCVHLQFL
jgi:hypothetical protein